MKIATKTLATLLIVTVMSIATMSGASAAALASDTKSKASNQRLERIQRRHDRKLELRATVLGMTSGELKHELKTKTFDQILKRHGFRDREAFHTALVGKLKDELKRRGWSDRKITHFLEKRAQRFAA